MKYSTYKKHNESHGNKLIVLCKKKDKQQLYEKSCKLLSLLVKKQICEKHMHQKIITKNNGLSRLSQIMILL